MKRSHTSAASIVSVWSLFSCFSWSTEFPRVLAMFFLVWHQKNEEIYALKNHHLILKSLHPERGCFYIFFQVYFIDLHPFFPTFLGQKTDLHCEVVVASSGHGVFSHQSSHCGGRRPWRSGAWWKNAGKIKALEVGIVEFSSIVFGIFWDIPSGYD